MFKSFVEEIKGSKVVAVTHAYADTIAEACNLIPDVAFIDINMDYETAGIDACRFIKNKHPGIKVCLVTAYERNAFKKELEGLCMDGYIDKAEFERKLPGLLR